MDFLAQNGTGGFLKYGSSRCFSEMLSFRDSFWWKAVFGLDLTTKRTHEPVRAATNLFVQNLRLRHQRLFLLKKKRFFDNKPEVLTVLQFLIHIHPWAYAQGVIGALN